MMNIVLFGATDLTLKIADFLYDNKYVISAIVTVPSVFKISYKPDGVSNTRFVDLTSWGKDKNIPVIIYENTLQLGEMLQKIGSHHLGIVAGWYHMIPKKIRDLFTIACVGFHASLLPELRGGAPLNWAILTNRTETGVSFFELTDGIDDGPLFSQDKFKLLPTDNITDLVKKTEISIMNILQRELPKFRESNITKYEQQGKPSYCGQRIPEDSLIDWHKSAEEIERLIRASTRPYSGAYSYLQGNRIVFWRAKIYKENEIHGMPGQIVYATKDTYIVACGVGAIEITNIETSFQLKTHQRFTSNPSI